MGSCISYESTGESRKSKSNTSINYHNISLEPPTEIHNTGQNSNVTNVSASTPAFAPAPALAKRNSKIPARKKVQAPSRATVKKKVHTPPQLESTYFPKGKSTVDKQSMQNIIKITAKESSNVKNENTDNKGTDDDNNYKNSMCNICYYEFDKDNHIYKLPCKCNKYYHKICVEAWFTKKPTCPFCSFNINTKKYQFETDPVVDNEFELWPEAMGLNGGMTFHGLHGAPIPVENAVVVA